MESTSPLAVLKARFGYDTFRPLQEEIVASALARRDSLVLMPTGGGKSICYQLPALLLDGVTLVVSPLIALMKDQTDALNANGIAARFINSSLRPQEIAEVQAQLEKGQVKILYAAPERLAMEGFRRFLRRLRISLIAIDEAHCISEWGHEFRPDYRNLRQLRAEFPSVPMMGLTATATQRVREDIVAQLDLQRGAVFLSSFNRENLNYSVRPKRNALRELLSLVRRRRDQSAIIYCYSRKETEDLAAELKAQGLRALPYHAGLDAETRRRTQEDFIRDRVPVIVATIAFGMGINKPDIRLVVHYNMPRSLEGYYQETGRAGRDGLASDCVLFYAYADKARQEYFIKQIEDAAERQQARNRLAAMAEFARIQTCRRRFLLEYFGESLEQENCGACDSCLRSGEEFDATEIAQMILSTVVRTGERFGATHVIRVMKGSRDKRILELGHDQLRVYGIARQFERSDLREIIGQLEARGLLVRGEGELPTLVLGPKGRQFLRMRERISLLRPEGKAAVAETATLRPGASRREFEFDRGLFEELRVRRRVLAEARGVPAFVIFGDVSLRHMAADLPWSLEEFSRVPGVGETKLAEYGPEFLEVIRTYAEANGLQRRPNATAARLQLDIPDGARKQPRTATLDATREMLAQGLSVTEIAQQRGLAEATIVGQMERLAGQGVSLELDHLMPSAERVRKIREAFQVCGDVYLRPVWEFPRFRVRLQRAAAGPYAHAAAGEASRQPGAVEGSGRPRSSYISTTAAKASWAFARASATVSPSVMSSGSSGEVTV